MSNIVTVPFYGDELTAVEQAEVIYVAVKAICERLGLDWKSQHRKLSSEKSLWGMVILSIPSAGGEQETVCIPISRLCAWLFSISPNKVKPELRAALERYQAEAADVLDRHFRLRLSSTSGQLTAAHTYILATSPRWARLHALIKGGAPKTLVWRRSGLSWQLFQEEFAEMVRCGLLSPDDWYEGTPRTATERIEQLESELALERMLREQLDARSGVVSREA